ncbi:MAG: hypothetical protein KTR26_00025 [Flammeovirgaceae bacterium]|nr:hypothetical protein [Flammeovirgaceae bacterium]
MKQLLLFVLAISLWNCNTDSTKKDTPLLHHLTKFDTISVIKACYFREDTKNLVLNHNLELKNEDYDGEFLNYLSTKQKQDLVNNLNDYLADISNIDRLEYLKGIEEWCFISYKFNIFKIYPNFLMNNFQRFFMVAKFL